MNKRVTASVGWSLSTILIVFVLFGLLTTASAQQGTAAPSISAQGVHQIQALMAEKASRTPAQRKIGSHLLYGMKASNGQAVAAGVQVPRSAVLPDAKGKVLVDIRANVSKTLLNALEQMGGQVTYSSIAAHSIRARVPMKKLEAIAARKDVLSIKPAIGAYTDRILPPGSPAPRFTPNVLAAVSPKILPGLKPGFEQRAQNIASQIGSQLTRKTKSGAAVAAGSNASADDTAGDVAHRANDARAYFGVSGAGIKVGVLSDSVDFLDQVQAAGNLPPVTVLPGQSGVGEGAGEGTAILEIIHALAPGAQLFFATAFNGDASFADNIRGLRAAGCDIIVDDVEYYNESPFEDGIIAQAVNDVTTSGALYFSSAGNEGNYDVGTAGVWQGDFKSGGNLALIPGGDVHNFGRGVISDLITGSGNVAALFWSDPLGGSGNDYDLYILDTNLSTVIDASTDFQDGTQDPFEILGYPSAGDRIVILRNDGAAVRALHVNTFRGILGLHTAGQTHGHNSAAKAFGVAAVDVATAQGGPFVGGRSEPAEYFTSDGPRRIFYNSDGTAITPGKVLFTGGGGQIRSKPDIAAADGVSVTTPGFDPFYGTSAAAPHAAAIAALLRSAKPKLTYAQIRKALTTTALDIEAPGKDRDTGAGLVTAYDALVSVGAKPKPYVVSGTITATPVNGQYIVPGGSATVLVQLINTGGADASNVKATLTTDSVGVTITQGTSAYPNLGSAGGSAVNTTPFTFTLAPDAECGMKVQFTLAVTYTGSGGPQLFKFSVQTGQLGDSSTTVAYDGPVVPIPDSYSPGVDVPIAVSGVDGNLAKLQFLIGGDSCSADAGAEGVGIDHTYVGDLIMTLTSPQGTSVILMNRPGSGGYGSSGNNFCQTLLDDSATTSIQSITSSDDPPLGPPYTGTFAPANPLATFAGENPNGTWTLNVSDNAGGDTGNVRAFSLIGTGYSCH